MRAIIAALICLLVSPTYSADDEVAGNRHAVLEGGSQERVLAMVRKGQYGGLDAWLAAAQTRYENGIGDDTELWRACRSFERIDERVLGTMFDEWVAQRPASYAARLARGCYLKGAGWRSRGTGYFLETQTHRVFAMREYFDEARTDLEAALGLTAKPTTALAALINIAGAEGDHVGREALLARALELDRAAFAPRDEHMHFLQPKWGGDFRAMELFAEGARKDLDSSQADMLAGLVPAYQADQLRLAAAPGSEDEKALLEQALALVERALELGPEHAGFHWRKGRLLAKLGRQSEALESFDRAVALSDAPEYYVSRAHTLLELGGHDEAVESFRYAADLGDRDAQQRLGWGYHGGHYGLRRDPAESLRWFLRAADWGENYAQYMVGELLREGAGGKPDFALAAKWYRLAAEDGYALAQGNLGSLYWNGMGVEQDRWEAMRWWRLAAAQGDANAKRNIEHLPNPIERLWVWVASEIIDPLRQLLSALLQLAGLGSTPDKAPGPNGSTHQALISGRQVIGRAPHGIGIAKALAAHHDADQRDCGGEALACWS